MGCPLTIWFASVLYLPDLPDVNLYLKHSVHIVAHSPAPPLPPYLPLHPNCFVRVKGVPTDNMVCLCTLFTWCRLVLEAFCSYCNPFTCPLPPLHPDYRERGVHWPYGMPLYFTDLMSTYTWSILFIQYPPVTVKGVSTDLMVCLCTLFDLMCSCTPATFCSNSNQFTCPPCPPPPTTKPPPSYSSPPPPPPH